MEVIQIIEEEKSKIKLAPYKIKQHNVATVSVIKGVNTLKFKLVNMCNLYKMVKRNVQVRSNYYLSQMDEECRDSFETLQLKMC